VKLELLGLDASSDNITINDTVTTRSYTALIPVDQVITSTTLIAAYDYGEVHPPVTRKSDQINTIGMNIQCIEHGVRLARECLSVCVCVYVAHFTHAGTQVYYCMLVKTSNLFINFYSLEL